MDKDAKSFFEKLSGIKRVAEDDEEEEEITAQILKDSGGDEDEEDEADEEAVSTETDDDEEESEDNKETLSEFFDEAEGQLTVDVYETPTHFVVKSAVAGVNSDKLDIAINNESVTIRGVREEEEKVKGQNYLHQECYWGRFARSIILPQEIDADKATASLKNGILKITLPKIIKAKTKKLKVKFE